MRFFLAFLAVFFSSCGLISVRPNNFPFFSGTYYEMMNRGSYPVVFALNGCTIGDNASENVVEPGEITSFRISNWSGQGAQLTVNYRRIQEDGRVIGAANHDVWSWGNERRSESVILTDEGVTRCGSIICRWQ
ncbi:MAG: hypothetical protein AAB518_03535 [Patescibacteria group bacterium]